MNKILLFAGTTEGRELAEACAGQPVELYVCVATEYGETLLPPADNIHVLAGRRDKAQMQTLIRDLPAALVIDATHPYAAEATETIRAACGETGAEYLRLLRGEEHEGTEHCVFVDSAAAAAAYLRDTRGNVLLTVGSKELDAFTGLADDQRRLFARILPLPQALERAQALGFPGKNLICMQGPFSEELNAAMLRMVDAAYLVTKDTGSAGGFPEKLRAAKACGVRTVVIRRPLREEGASPAACLELLRQRFGLSRRKTVILMGVGMGSAGSMTLDGERACREAELIVGAKRLTDSLARFHKPCVNAVAAAEIAKVIKSGAAGRIVIALSGDSGFYSGAKKLLPLLAEYHPAVLPGISSISYFCSRLGIGWDDALLLSTHGRGCNFLAKIRRNPKVIALTGGALDAAAVIGALKENGLGEVRIAVGENLSDETERIIKGTAAALAGQRFAPLAVLLAENPAASAAASVCGRPDAEFLRAEVPMTKQEVRAVTLAKLRLHRGAICYDVGAGTGSVSLEMADCCEDGMVYAVEQKPEACALIERNKRHLAVSNVQVVQGSAPAALAALPAPTHAFIGGSGGSLREILVCLLEKNPAVRLVINTVTAESFAEAVTCLKTLPVGAPDIVQVSVARGQKLGGSHLMTAQNPVYVISCTGGETDEKK